MLVGVGVPVIVWALPDHVSVQKRLSVLAFQIVMAVESGCVVPSWPPRLKLFRNDPHVTALQVLAVDGGMPLGELGLVSRRWVQLVLPLGDLFDVLIYFRLPDRTVSDRAVLRVRGLSLNIA